MWLADRGRRDEAEAALTAALNECMYDPAAELVMIPAIRRLDAWTRAAECGAAAEGDGCDEPTRPRSTSSRSR